MPSVTDNVIYELVCAAAGALFIVAGVLLRKIPATKRWVWVLCVGIGCLLILVAIGFLAMALVLALGSHLHWFYW